MQKIYNIRVCVCVCVYTYMYNQSPFMYLLEAILTSLLLLFHRRLLIFFSFTQFLRAHSRISIMNMPQMPVRAMKSTVGTCVHACMHYHHKTTIEPNNQPGQLCMHLYASYKPSLNTIFFLKRAFIFFSSDLKNKSNNNAYTCMHRIVLHYERRIKLTKDHACIGVCIHSKTLFLSSKL